ncbi:hypothetical protein PseudUWO311_22450 [Pseudanabaena sp. UWO311]|uniref:hypothetical protein n=1 Tax=Pseudanabaena sp. UWO311 TaxID=2487337 RepID=UPI00115B15E7|nr:hypothetical protein [Pseudanabaena sp. UWO311]TYQ23474.1 hypothetical protein PseudUWO311_22450 [Pseudanabaena sp. UWO311]
MPPCSPLLCQSPIIYRRAIAIFISSIIYDRAIAIFISSIIYDRAIAILSTHWEIVAAYKNCWRSATTGRARGHRPYHFGVWVGV